MKFHSEYPRAPCLVVTQGTQPTLICTQSEIKSFPVPVVSPELIVDFIGSGDAFFGGFLVAWFRVKQNLLNFHENIFGTGIVC
jgi:sugar/nucleoside kinase (ribokinase family)